MVDPKGAAIMKRFIGTIATLGFLTAAALGLANTAAAATLENNANAVEQLVAQEYGESSGTDSAGKPITSTDVSTNHVVRIVV